MNSFYKRNAFHKNHLLRGGVKVNEFFANLKTLFKEVMIIHAETKITFYLLH